MLIGLADAEPATSGGKAAVLARLLQAGMPVPPGFVVPTAVYEEAVRGVDLTDPHAAQQLVEQVPTSPALVDAISRALGQLAGPSGELHVAVRSSAANEDTADASAAGQHDTFLAVSGPDRVADAVRRCWVSLWSGRAVGYRRWQAPGVPTGSPTIAVLVQRLVDADVAGVMFTGADIRLEASWGLGETVVSGQVTPDSWVVSGDTVARRVLGVKDIRSDREGTADRHPRSATRRPGAPLPHRRRRLPARPAGPENSGPAQRAARHRVGDRRRPDLDCAGPADHRRPADRRVLQRAGKHCLDWYPRQPGNRHRTGACGPRPGRLRPGPPRRRSCMQDNGSRMDTAVRCHRSGGHANRRAALTRRDRGTRTGRAGRAGRSRSDDRPTRRRDNRSRRKHRPGQARVAGRPDLSLASQVITPRRTR